MADINKVIRVGDTLTNIIDSVTKKSVNYRKVTTWYDGSPMTDEKVDGVLYRKKGSEYFRQVIDKDGELFLEKDTVAQLRALSPYEILLLRAGVYKGVTLSGYYSKGDTPGAIQYYLSDTTESDDGGSVFEVGGIKLDHEFVGSVDVRYFGAIPNGLSNSFFQKCEEYCYANNLVMDFGSSTYKINQNFNIRCETTENGATIQVEGNPLEAITINKGNVVLFNKDYYLPHITNLSKPAVGYEGVYTGVKTFDLNSCRIYTKDISNFSDGLYLSASTNTGNSYNTVFVGHHRNNKNNITLNPENPGGWCNENLFIGGRLSKLSHEIGNGSVIRVDVVDGGSGYTNATISLSEGGTGGSGFQANVNVAGGMVTSVDIITAGVGYNRTLRGTISGDGSGALIRVVVAEPNSTQIKMLENAFGTAGGSDNNMFLHVSVEGDNVDRHVICEGRNNTFYQCRWEAIRPNVHFVRRSNSANGGARNSIFQGYSSDVLFITTEGSGNRWNQIDRERAGKNIEAFNQALRLRSSNGTSLIRMYGSVANFLNRGIIAQSDNGWNVDFGHFGLKLKDISNAYDKIFLDGINGRIYLGTGSDEVVPFISSGNGSPEGVVFAPAGSLYLNRQSPGSVGNNLYVKTTLSNYNNGWVLSNFKPAAATNRTGVVLQIAASADTATQASGETPTKAEFDALLAELRDLKTKMRAGVAPILSS